MLGSRTGPDGAGRWRDFAALALVGALGCAAPEPSDGTAAAARLPDILLVTVDTLRADRLSAYGYARQTSPFLAQLAADGVRFDRAYSTSSWTVPAVVSMLTSTYPTRHGMGERAGRESGSWQVIPEDLPSLPRILRSAGYRTYGFTANFGLPPERGFSHGFDRYRCAGAVDLEVVEEELEPWLPDLHGGGPWFFWLHLFDPHAPYVERQPWLAELRPEATRPAGADRSVSAGAVADVTLVPWVEALYDSELRHLDAYLARFFELVPRSADAFVLFTADHGEEFLDHGGVLHGRTLFDEVVRIPFIMRLPDRGSAGRVVDAPVSLIDVLPTLLAVAGIESPPGASGTSLVGPGGLRDPGRRAVFAELERTDRQRAVTDGRWKYIQPGDPSRPGALFDLLDDPAESRDLSAALPRRVDAFRRLLADFEDEHARPAGLRDETAITPQQDRALRDLGYVQ